MRPTPIPDEDVAANPDHQRVVIAPPAGYDIDGPIRSVEALVGPNTEIDDVTTFRFRVVLEDDDLERLTAGAAIWISMCGHVVPWSIQVG